MSVHVWYGEDDFRIKESLSDARHQVGIPELWDANTISLTGPGLTPNNLVHACSMVPFLAEKRMTIVEGLFSLFEPTGRQGNQKASLKGNPNVGPWKDSLPYLKLLPPTTILIFLDGRLSLNNPLLKIVSNVAEVREFPILRGENLKNWVRKKLAATEGDMVPGALRLICELIGGNLWAMQGELDKLQLYAHGRSIEEGDIHLLVSSAREANVFSMVDAVLYGNGNMAIKGIHELIESGKNASYIISMLARQLRLILLAKEISQKKVPERDWGARLGLASSFAIKKTMDQANRQNDKRILSLYKELLRLDLEIKTGQLNETLALEILVSQASRP
jgi:DNA polymerase-3 subunit delta